MHWLATPDVWELGAEGTLWLQALGGGMIGLLAGTLALLVGIYSRRRPRRTRSTAKTLDQRLSELSSLAAHFQRLSNEVKAQASAQVRIAKRAAEEAEKNTKLASVSKEQAAAVAEVFAAQGRVSLRVTIWIGIVSLIVSNGVTVIVTLAFAK